jgi:hypothetical protein
MHSRVKYSSGMIVLRAKSFLELRICDGDIGLPTPGKPTAFGGLTAIKIQGATRLRLRAFCLAGLALALIFLAGHVRRTYGQTVGSRPYPEEAPSCDVPDSGFLTVDADRRGFAELSLRTCFQPEHEQKIRDKLPEALGCPAEHIQFSSFKDEGLCQCGPPKGAKDS